MSSIGQSSLPGGRRAGASLWALPVQPVSDIEQNSDDNESRHEFPIGLKINKYLVPILTELLSRKQQDEIPCERTKKRKNRSLEVFLLAS